MGDTGTETLWESHRDTERETHSMRERNTHGERLNTSATALVMQQVGIGTDA